MPHFSVPNRPRSAFAVIAAALFATCAPAAADKVLNPTAVFSGLDKITGRIIAFEVAMDETVQFGSLQITPRVCISRPPREAPLTDGFIEVDEIGEKTDDKPQFRRIFSGWMFAASPGLHGVEHPVYDVWLTDCKGGTEVIAAPQVAETDPPPNADVLANTGREPKPKETRRRAEQQPRAPRDPNALPVPGAQPGAPPPTREAGPIPGLFPPRPPGAIPSRDPSALAPPAPEGPRRAPTQRFFPTSRQPDFVPQPLDPAGR